MLLAKELERLGCPLSAARVEQVIIELFDEKYPDDTTETLLADTPRADQWVRQVWDKLGYRLPHRVINLTLIKLRKAARIIPRGKRRVLDVSETAHAIR
jgi:hypothetical protein